MKTLFVAGFGLFLSLHLSGQWTADTLQNTVVRDDALQPAVTPLMCDGPNGSTYISWFETQGGQYVLKMQLLDVDGYAQWPADGLLISSHPQNSALFRYDLAADNDGNAIVAFQDERTGQLDIVVYKIAPDGTFLWGVDGIPLSDPGSSQGLAPVIGVLSNNDVLIAWNANAASSWIAYARIDEDGTLLWAVPHQIIGTDRYTRPRVVASGNSGYIIQYVVETGSGFPPTSTLFAQKFDALDQFLWGPVQLSSKTIPFFHFPEPITDGHGGLYILFQTSNSMNTSLSDVYLQRLYNDGALWNQLGEPMLEGTGTQRYPAGLAFVDDAVGVMVALKVTDIAQSIAGISIQRCDTGNTVLFLPSGSIVIAPNANYDEPIDLAATDDGAVLIHREGSMGSGRIRATRLDIFGIPLWSMPMRTLCAVNAAKDDIACGSVRNDQLVTVWTDDRTNSGVFAQNLDASGGIGPVGITPSSPRDDPFSLLTDPADRPEIVPAPGIVGPFDLSVREAGGKIVRTTRIPGRSRLEYQDLPAGIYTIEIVQDGRRSTLRWCRP
ncbi:MAG: hypothetical protein H6595_03540 [Flavobacteriales bacterium]|nr:hypothetical protein [Flavobacteriales bacterium]MCB9166532.1 hypothetical protein [Flavobacteriales bacterium]